MNKGRQFSDVPVARLGMLWNDCMQTLNVIGASATVGKMLGERWVVRAQLVANCYSASEPELITRNSEGLHACNTRTFHSGPYSSFPGILQDLH